MKFYFRICFLIIVTLATVRGAAQRNIQLEATLGMNGGFTLAQIEKTGSINWYQNLGNAIGLNGGLNLSYKHRFNFGVNYGFVIQSYKFTGDNGRYDIASITSKVTSNLNYRWILSEKYNSYFQFGSDVGLLFYGYDKESEVNQEFTAYATSYGPRRLFVAPEFGISKQEKRFNFSILATYFNVFGASNAIITTVQTPTGLLTANTKGNYVGIKLRASYTIAGNIEPKNIALPKPSNRSELESRSIQEIASLKVKRKTLILEMADVGQIDNDSISIIVNGDYLLTYHQLTNERKKLKIRLKKGENEIFFIAHNEGSIPPNTGRCYLKSGGKKWTFPVSTKLDQNAVIRILVE
ncbi:MAG: hypothetical protein R2809_05975 [Flavobacteriales bacterium]